MGFNILRALDSPHHKELPVPVSMVPKLGNPTLEWGALESDPGSVTSRLSDLDPDLVFIMALLSRLH